MLAPRFHRASSSALPTARNVIAPWQLRSIDARAAEQLARAQAVPDVVARLLLGRGHAADASFLQPSLKQLHEPGGERGLPDLELAAERLVRAIRAQEVVLVHGDYDVDGVTGTAILVRVLRLAGARVVWHIPNRLEDGYSFGAHSVTRALAAEAGVVVSVDNGTSAGETISELRRHGIDTIVTDHHEPPRDGSLPPAIALVNPKLPGSRYPFPELCGSGVAFKLAWGIAQALSGGSALGRVRDDLRAFLFDAMAYVAMATVCDVVPLVGENRVLALYGLQALARSRTPGLAALRMVSGLKSERLTAEDVGYQIGPRLNAAGRLGRADLAVELLLCDDPTCATRLARELDELNVERRAIEARITGEALEAARAFDDPERWPVLVLGAPGWHQGVVGIVASRLVDRFHRPALVIGVDGALGRGSARSVPGFSVLDAMHGGAALMQRYGGHAAAAGCEIDPARLDELREAICAQARELLGSNGFPVLPLIVDAELPLAAMTAELMRHIDRLEPFGEANEKPVFQSTAHVAQPPRRVGRDESHLLLQLRDGTHAVRAMAFGQARRHAELALGSRLAVAYTPRWNTFRGTTSLELVVHDLRPLPG